VVRTPASDPGAYRLALKRAETACRLSPFNANYQITLGLAEYRLGDFAAAMDTLARADQANSLVPQGSPPANLAFLAMAQFQLGRHGEARMTFQRLQDAMKRPAWPHDADEQAFFREAETLIGNQPGN
jgi:tetratricopeptide (TPR) repeat protein